MYLPKHFAPNDEENALQTMEAFPFATLISIVNGKPFISHLPVLIQRDQKLIVGHMARANPHWRFFEENPMTTLLFHGPHTYITPTWYQSGRDVPTWNYAVIHVTGQSRLIEDSQGITEIVKKMSKRFEAGSMSPWEFELPEDLVDPSALTKAIVGFEVQIEEIQAKFKLSQNRSQEDRLGVIQGLEGRKDEMSGLVREMMIRNEERKSGG
jgi:transcriptional regulator